MKLNIPCGHCFREGQLDIVTELDLSNDGVYEVVCSNGHASIDFIYNEKYELIFDLGLLALDNGFSRESVSSFAVSLERFYEYCIRVMMISSEVRNDSIDQAWKLVSSQSERQVGAFYFLFLAVFKEIPDAFPQKQVKFRNDVIHKGHIPSKNEVLEFAKEVYQYIIKYTVLLKKELQSSMDELSIQKESAVNRQYKGESICGFTIGTTLSRDVPISSLENGKFDAEMSIYYLKGLFPLYVK